MTEFYTTPQVAAAARTSKRAIRIWEAKGLFGLVRRNKRDERLFTAPQLQRAKIISAATMAGMALDEIKNKPDIVLLAKISEAAAFMQDVRGFDL
jgi:DNA-binding transcriptional MerR regulator